MLCSHQNNMLKQYRYVIDCPPEPALMRFIQNKHPHLIHLHLSHQSLIRADNFNLNTTTFHAVYIVIIYLPGPLLCFFKIAVTVSLEMPNMRPVARVPVPFTDIFKTWLRTFGR